MRLLDAIIEANHAAVEGRKGEVYLDKFADELPVAALTCIDRRLNRLFPGALALDDEQFLWLRNAGNVITSPTSSTVRSVSIAVLLKGAKEIALIGHTDCQMAKLTMLDLLTRLEASGISRSSVPVANLQEFFGLFSSETQNVIKGVAFLRQSPLIPKQIPVHGFLINTQTGRLDWVVNGYETLGQPAPAAPPSVAAILAPIGSLFDKIEPLVAPKWEAATARIGAESPSFASLLQTTQPTAAQKLEELTNGTEPPEPSKPPPLPPRPPPLPAGGFKWPQKK